MVVLGQVVAGVDGRRPARSAWRWSSCVETLYTDDDGDDVRRLAVEARSTAIAATEEAT